MPRCHDFEDLSVIPGVPPMPEDPAKQLAWRLGFDFLWVCANLLRITAKKGNKLVFLRLNDGQLWVYWNLLDQWCQGMPARLWILKGRQFGVSTMFCARQFVKTAFHGHNCLVLPHKEAPGKVMFGKIERMLKNLPVLRYMNQPLQLVSKPTTHETGTQMVWNEPPTEDGGDGFSALVKRETAENPDAGVSETYQHVHLTEMPLWKDAHHTMGGLLPTIPDDVDTTIVAEFTARGEGDYTHSVWEAAEAGESTFRGIFLPWYWHADYQRPRRADDAPFTQEELDFRAWVGRRGSEYPLVRRKGVTLLRLKPKFAAIHAERDLLPSDLEKGFALSDEQLLWRRDTIKAYRRDIDMFRREYPSTSSEAFASSGRRLIPASVMDALDEGHKEPIDCGEFESHLGAGGKTRVKYRRRSDGRVWRFEEPEAGVRYVVDADPASGVGRDYSAAQVLKVEYRRVTVVASFRGKVRPHEFARIIARLGRMYRSDASENGVGGAVTGGKPALAVVEVNGHGTQVVYELDQHLRYKPMFRPDERGTSSKWAHKHRFGFLATKRTKMPMLDNLVQMAYDNELVVPCVRTRREMRSMVYLDDDDEKAGAPQGLNDDLCMSLGWGCLAASQLGRFKRRPEGVSRARVRRRMFPITGR